MDQVQRPITLRQDQTISRVPRVFGEETKPAVSGGYVQLVWNVCILLSRVKGGRYLDIARGFVYKTKLLWAQQIVQPLQLVILYSASAWLLLFFVLIG